LQKQASRGQAAYRSLLCCRVSDRKNDNEDDDSRKNDNNKE